MYQLTVINQNGTLLADSREVAEMTNKRHDHLLRDIDGYVAILLKSTAPNFGVSDFFIESNYTDSTGRTLKRYLLTRKGCDMVANKMIGEKGVLFTATYVTKFEEMERELSNPKMALPQNYVEALKALVISEEEKIALVQKIESDRPMVLFAESLQVSKDSILVADLAKLLKQNGIDIGEVRLFKWLRENGYLIKSGSEYNTPTQRSMELKIMEIKTGYRGSSDGTTKITRTPKITGKGQIYFVNKFKALQQAN